MVEKDETEIKINYTRANDFKLIPASGAFGGVNPQGDILCNFFIDFNKYPEKFSVVVDKKTGKYRDKYDPNERKVSIRELQVGIVLRPDIALIIGKWLINEAEKIMGKPPEKK